MSKHALSSPDHSTNVVGSFNTHAPRCKGQRCNPADRESLLRAVSFCPFSGPAMTTCMTQSHPFYLRMSDDSAGIVKRFAPAKASLRAMDHTASYRECLGWEGERFQLVCFAVRRNCFSYCLAPSNCDCHPCGKGARYYDRGADAAPSFLRALWKLGWISIAPDL